MSDFSHRAIESIDKMQWLDFADLGKPISDVDTYLNYVSKWPLFDHLISAALCLGFSALFHLCYVYSENVNILLAKLDYGGITILIFGSTVPAIEYVFACNSVQCKIRFLTFLVERQFFMSLVSICCLSTFIVTLMPIFSRPDFKVVRGGIFLMLGVSISSPLLYVIFNL
jgi:adiponectin receptor